MRAKGGSSRREAKPLWRPALSLKLASLPRLSEWGWCLGQRVPASGLCWAMHFFCRTPADSASGLSNFRFSNLRFSGNNLSKMREARQQCRLLGHILADWNQEVGEVPECVCV